MTLENFKYRTDPLFLRDQLEIMPTRKSCS